MLTRSISEHYAEQSLLDGCHYGPVPCVDGRACRCLVSPKCSRVRAAPGRSSPALGVLRKNSRATLKRVVMVYAAESLMGNDVPSVGKAVSRYGGAAPESFGSPGPRRGMWPFSVVVRHPLGQNVAQVPFVKGNDPVEALAPCGADEPFAVRVRLRRPWRCAQDLERH